jgi:hypothetical protein
MAIRPSLEHCGSVLCDSHMNRWVKKTHWTASGARFLHALTRRRQTDTAAAAGDHRNLPRQLGHEPVPVEVPIYFNTSEV